MAAGEVGFGIDVAADVGVDKGCCWGYVMVMINRSNAYLLVWAVFNSESPRYCSLYI